MTVSDFKAPISILLAEDDEDDVFFFKQALAENDVESNLIVAKDGMEVMDILASEPSVDIIFLDINMPLKNGLECLKEINLMQNEVRAPVIILSTTQNEDLIKNVKKLGAAGYIKKATSFLKYKLTIKDVLKKNWKTGLRPDFYIA